MSALASRPYRLLSSARCQKIADSLTALVDPLSKRWLTVGNIDLVAITAFEDMIDPPSHVQYLVKSAGGWVALYAGRDDWKRLAQQFLGCTVGSLTPLVRAVLSKFALDCLQAISEDSLDSSLTTDIKWGELPSSAFSRGAGVISAQLRVQDALLNMIAPPEMWPALFGHEIRLPKSPVESAKQALANCGIELEVKLPSVQMPLPRIGQLAVGDFLNLGQSLDGRVVITGKDVDVCFEGTLGQSNERRAVLINSTLAEKNS